jgi:hypothetical protein
MAFSIKRWAPIGLASAVVTISSLALAGSTYGSPITISGNTAYGTLAYARYSSDTNESIGCYTEAFPGSATLVYCSVRDPDGKYLGCTSTDSNIAATARSINDTSFVEFHVAADGTCTFLIVQDYSGNIH